MDEKDGEKIFQEMASKRKGRNTPYNEIFHMLQNNKESLFPVLVQKTKDEDDGIRAFSCLLLGETSDPAAVPVLIESLKDDTQNVGRTAVNAICKIGISSAQFEIIMEKLDSYDPNERAAAAQLLGKLKDPSAVPSLVKKITDEDWWVRVCASEAIAMIGDCSVVPALIEITNDPNCRYHAIQALGELRNKSAAPAIIDFLKDEQDNVRCYAAEALGKINEATTASALYDVLGDDCGNVRFFAAWALGEMQDEAATPKLIYLLDQEDDWQGSRGAAEALAKIKSPLAISALIRKIGEINQGFPYIIGLIKSVGEPAIPYLIEALKDKDLVGRTEAAKMLMEIGFAKVPELKDRILTLLILGKTDTVAAMREDAVPYLIEALKNMDQTVRCSAAKALGNIGDISVVPILIDTLKDKNSEVVESAAFALGRLGDVKAVPALIEALKDKTKIVQFGVANALNEIAGSMANKGDHISALKIIKETTLTIIKFYPVKDRYSWQQRRQELSEWNSLAEQIHDKMNSEKKRFPVKHQPVRTVRKQVRING